MLTGNRRNPLTKVLGTSMVLNTYEFMNNILLYHKRKLSVCTTVDEI